LADRMYDLQAEATKQERALLIGVSFGRRSKWEEADSLEELGQLTKTAGAIVVEKLLQQRKKPDAATYIGRGMADQLHTLADELAVDTIIFDQDLSPAQVRNLKQIIEVKIVDRTELILDIFALHARTKQAKIEVELAQLNYRLSRLVGSGEQLSRLGGGIGTRGPGEQKLEVDRRRIRDRIRHLKDALEEVERTGRIQRQGRDSFFRVALVGYTNAGKSTIMNGLSGAGVKVGDELFATLDATTRLVHLPDDQEVLLTDTVGFIKDLPHHLVTSFHATLEEAIEADLRLHVVDASHPCVRDQMAAAEQVLERLGCSDQQTLAVFNKMDKVVDACVIDRLREEYTDSVLTSATEGDGMDELRQTLVRYALAAKVEAGLSIPVEEGKLLAEAYEHGQVLSRHADNEYVYLRVRMPILNFQRLQKQLEATEVSRKRYSTGGQSYDEE
jgi:GTP-binding protein HflX